jgi:cytochrome c biogenesis protein CcmG/thiol:disulfide interchange protein DsbE
MTTLVNEQAPAEKKRSGSLTTFAIMIGLLVLGVVIAVALYQQGQSQPTDGPAPNFEMTTFDGEEFALSDFEGKVVVLNFWASWCAECAVEASDLQAVHEYYGDDVAVVGIAYADNGPGSLDYLNRYGITYLNAPDRGTRISDDYRIRGVPETFIIDQRGDIAYLHVGIVTLGELMTEIDTLLETGGTS